MRQTVPAPVRSARLALVPDPEPAPPLRDLFSAAAWFGLVGGLLELLVLGVKHFVLHQLIRLGPQIVWMTPAADALLFLVLALPLALLSLRWPAARAPRNIARLFAFTAVLGVLMIEHWSYPLGFVFFAAGAAVEAGRLAGDHARAFRTLVRRTLPALALLVAGLGVGRATLAWRRERGLLAALPAARAGTPNVLLLIWDTVRASDLSLYGYARPTTPNLDRVAAGGVTFEQAVSTAPWTLPSHASIFTGRWPQELSVGWRAPLDGRWPTLAEVLDRRGYATAGFVANTIYTSRELGLARGFAHYEDYRVSPGEFVLASSLLRAVTNDPTLRRLTGDYQILGRKTAADVNAELLRWLDHRPAGHPFFAFLNEFDAHEPYLPPAPYDTLFGALPSRRHWDVANRTNSAEHERRWTMTPAQIAAERATYDGGIAYMDAQLGRLLAALERRGLLRNTIVVVAADHGEQFGAHGVFEHGNSLFMAVLHVPLVVAGAGIPAGVRVGPPVSLVELPATIARLAGVRQPSFRGRSLDRYWTPEDDGGGAPVFSEVQRVPSSPRWYPVHAGDMRSLVNDGFQLIRRADGREQLFDLRTDPRELRDLATRPARAALVERLRAGLRTVASAP